jgi:hypothetical protein
VINYLMISLFLAEAGDSIGQHQLSLSPLYGLLFRQARMTLPVFG